MKKLEDENSQHRYDFAVSFRRLNELREEKAQEFADGIRYQHMTLASLESEEGEKRAKGNKYSRERMRCLRETRQARGSLRRVVHNFPSSRTRNKIRAVY